MKIEEFTDSLESMKIPPAQLSLALQALWWDAKGDWANAHQVAQDAGDAEGDWVHAYLHRAEGDEGNASYWYSRSGKSFPKTSLKDEWRAIVGELLGE